MVRGTLVPVALAHDDLEQRIDGAFAIALGIERERQIVARLQLLKLIEAMGPTDPLVASARRRLSSLLFS